MEDLALYTGDMLLKLRNIKGEKMKTSYWGKTLLYVYKYLPRVTEGIDKLVERTAMNSFYFNSNQIDNGVYAVAEKMLNLVERKKRLINIKVLVDKSLLACDNLSGQILIERYIDNDSSEVISKRHNLNIRTYFRRLESAEFKLYSIMSKLGYDEKKLNNYLSGEKWIIEVFEKLKDEDKDNEKEEVEMAS